VVDVRTPASSRQARTRAQTTFPSTSVEKRLADFGDHKRAIVVYCRSGHRSGQAKAILDKNGFTDVTDGGAFKDMLPRDGASRTQV